MLTVLKSRQFARKSALSPTFLTDNETEVDLEGAAIKWSAKDSYYNLYTVKTASSINVDTVLPNNYRYSVTGYM